MASVWQQDRMIRKLRVSKLWSLSEPAVTVTLLEDMVHLHAILLDRQVCQSNPIGIGISLAIASSKSEVQSSKNRDLC